MLFPTSLVGSYPQPDWLTDRERLAGRFPPRVRARELWRAWPRASGMRPGLPSPTRSRLAWTSSPGGEISRESFSNALATALDGVDIHNPGNALDRSGHPNPVPRIVGILLPGCRDWRKQSPAQVHEPGPIVPVGLGIAVTTGMKVCGKPGISECSVRDPAPDPAALSVPVPVSVPPSLVPVPVPPVPTAFPPPAPTCPWPAPFFPRRAELAAWVAAAAAWPEAAALPPCIGNTTARPAAAAAKMLPVTAAALARCSYRISSRSADRHQAWRGRCRYSGRSQPSRGRAGC
jgi:hypothetical protein